MVMCGVWISFGWSFFHSIIPVFSLANGEQYRELLSLSGKFPFSVSHITDVFNYSTHYDVGYRHQQE